MFHYTKYLPTVFLYSLQYYYYYYYYYYLYCDYFGLVLPLIIVLLS